MKSITKLIRYKKLKRKKSTKKKMANIKNNNNYCIMATKSLHMRIRT